MLAKEISYLDTDFKRSAVTSDPTRYAKRFADNANLPAVQLGRAR